jgi:hypothetical protein
MAKPRKVEEPAGTYSASSKQPAKPAANQSSSAERTIRYARSEDVQKVAEKIFAERKDLFRKLAQ